MQKIEVVVRITKDHCPPQEQTIFEWVDLMRNPTDVLRSPGLEINLEHHRVFKHGTEVYMSRYEYGVLSLMAQHPGKLFTKEQIFEAVWHKDSDSYLRAVTSTIGRIRQKIEDDKDHPRYQGEYSRERLILRLRTVHPKTITRLAQNGTGNVADRHMKQILSIYNGAGRAHSLPCKR